MKKWIYRLIELVLLCVIIFCLWKIGSYFLGRKISDDSFTALERIVEERKDQEGDQGKEEKKLDYQSIMKDLREKNEDVIAYLQVEGTKINYPVVQAKNNDYYLRRGLDKKYSFQGIPYMDYRNNPNLEDQNTVIYGHMMNIGKTSMFGYFQDFLDQAYTDESPKNIQMITDRGVYRYRMIAMTFLPEAADYRNPQMKEKEFLDHVNRLIKGSEVDFRYGQSILPKDKILTLSTCTPDQDASRRLVILAVLINKDE